MESFAFSLWNIRQIRSTSKSSPPTHAANHWSINLTPYHYNDIGPKQEIKKLKKISVYLTKPAMVMLFSAASCSQRLRDYIACVYPRVGQKYQVFYYSGPKILFVCILGSIFQQRKNCILLSHPTPTCKPNSTSVGWTRS